MNWKTIFENQYKLDAHIEDKHPRQEGEDRLKKKVVAFCTELGEMANEWRGFKFWSERQEPSVYYKPKDDGKNIVPDYDKPFSKVLEEYIDIVHFTASIGLELKIDQYYLDPYKKGSRDVLDIIHDLFFSASLVGYSEEKFKMYNVVLNRVTQLGIELGFTEEQIMDAYDKKNAKNFKRQESGY